MGRKILLRFVQWVERYFIRTIIVNFSFIIDCPHREVNIRVPMKNRLFDKRQKKTRTQVLQKNILKNEREQDKNNIQSNIHKSKLKIKHRICYIILYVQSLFQLFDPWTLHLRSKIMLCLYLCYKFAVYETRLDCMIRAF